MNDQTSRLLDALIPDEVPRTEPGETLLIFPDHPGWAHRRDATDPTRTRCGRPIHRQGTDGGVEVTGSTWTRFTHPGCAATTAGDGQAGAPRVLLPTDDDELTLFDEATS